jgi:hypothetical protein
MPSNDWIYQISLAVLDILIWGFHPCRRTTEKIHAQDSRRNTKPCLHLN